MLVDVALTPLLLQQPADAICIVVDVLRASSACVTIFDRGARMVAVSPTPEAARNLRRDLLPHALLCGEVGGLPPEGFDYGNSPSEFAGLDLDGRDAILATSNGTRALHAVAGSPAAYVGCLLNRTAVCAAAMAVGDQVHAGIRVVCAGNDYGRAFSLDDAFTAGAIIAELERLAGRDSNSADFALTDAAQMSRRLFASYGGEGGEAVQVFRDGSHGQTLDRLGFAADLEFCARLDRSTAVPALQQEREGLLVLRWNREEARAE